MSAGNIYLLHFNGRHDNLGDQFIFRALAGALSRLGDVHMRHAIPAFILQATSGARVKTMSDWRLAGRSAMAALRGGAVYNFLPPGGRTWTAAPPAAGSPARALLTQARRAGTNLVAGRRIAIGASVIPAANHAWCQDCDWIGVRDQESLAALRAAGLSRVDYFPDLSFLPSPPRTIAPRRSGIRVSFRRTIPEAADEAPRYESRLVDAFARLTRVYEGESRHQLRAFFQVEEDEPFTRRVSRAHDVVFEPARVTLDTFESFYGSAEIVISNRLHCLLLGAYCGAVPIALTSRAHTKVTSLFETVGWDALILPIEDGAGLLRRFAAIQGDLANLRRVVATSFEAQRRLGLEMLEHRFGGRDRDR